MQRKVSETATPRSNATTRNAVEQNAAARTRLDDPTFREAIARMALSGPGLATLREAQAALQPDYPNNANTVAPSDARAGGDDDLEGQGHATQGIRDGDPPV